MTVIKFGRYTWPWALAGVISGMAILTRATGLILIGVVGLALILQVISSTRAGMRVGHAIRRATLAGAIWLITTCATIYALLPALWVDPASTLRKLWSWSSEAATEGHENPTFFRGIHHEDPGLLVYPLVLAWRTSSIEWIGLGLFLTLSYWAWKRRSQKDFPHFKFLLVCIVFATVYIAAMSVGAKKFDRYILPIFPIVALLAAHGIVLAKQWVDATLRPGWNKIGSVLLVIALLAQVVSWHGNRPYRLDYYNPILGGAQRAQFVLQMGWGQGGDEVVEYLEEQSRGQPITAQTSAVPSAFTYFLDEDSPIEFRSFSMRTPAGWYETDYYVAGIQQTQRDLAPGFDLVSGDAPDHSILINGVSYFDIFNVRNLPLPAELAGPTACNLVFDGTITLMQIVGRDDAIDLYFLTTGETNHGHIEFEVSLDWSDETVSTESSVLAPAPYDHMSRLTIPYEDSGTPLSEMTISLRASAEAQPLIVSTAWTSDQAEQGRTHSECFYTDVPE